METWLVYFFEPSRPSLTKSVKSDPTQHPKQYPKENPPQGVEVVEVVAVVVGRGVVEVGVVKEIVVVVVVVVIVVVVG
ncbi:hypothetical protein ElyMa_005060600 [Elysia marginata]|uniref:Transmembrane protein n=1 Tax=Elysia marginata TaxID=1093978 RepID=A0AAV4JHY6_9GAST|nr:hypothetical protein ElyMa_005060600 [Elysia marginata]